MVLEKLYFEAFPAQASKGLYKIEGLQDLAKNKLSSALGWGYKVPSLENTKVTALKYTIDGVLEKSEGELLSYLGTPIFQPIIFKAGGYFTLKDGEAVLENFSTDYMLPATCTAEFSRSKKIIKTDISGFEGSVKECFAISDWDIQIRGLILSTSSGGNNHHVYPENELLELAKYERLVDSIEVAGGMFNLLGIKRIVIESATFGKTQGMENVIPFSFKCISDVALELEVVEF